MSNTTAPPNLSSLFGAAKAAGELSPGSAAVLTLPDYGAAIQAGLGIKVDDVTASEVFLVSVLVDDSGSMSPNAKAARDGHNEIVDALVASKQGDGILAACQYLFGTMLYPFTPIASAVKMDGKNYRADGSHTPLYDRAIVVLGTAIAKAQEFADNGVVCRTATLIVTDGADNSSSATPAKVKKIVEDMLRQERHIVAGMGIEDGYTDFTGVFRGMGIRDEWILTPKNSPSELRRAFQVFSRSAVRASQSAASFSKTAAGGFGTP